MPSIKLVIAVVILIIVLLAFVWYEQSLSVTPVTQVVTPVQPVYVPPAQIQPTPITPVYVPPAQIQPTPITPVYVPPTSPITPVYVPQYPGGLQEGQFIRCTTERNGAIYRLENGMKRWIPSAEAYAKFGNPVPTNVSYACGTAIPEGTPF